MTKEEYDRLPAVHTPVPFIELTMMQDRFDRTLLWGYTTERCSWHVYLQNRQIHHIVYDWNDEIHFQASGVRFESESLVPNKRLYPEACDAEFCGLLLQQGINLPFTTWDDRRLPLQFHGRTVIWGVLSPKQPVLRKSVC